MIQEAFSKIPGARPFPSMGGAFNNKQAGPQYRWDDEHWIKEQLLATGFDEMSIELHSVDHTVSREEFVKVMGGPMIRGLMGFFGYSKEEVADIAPKVAPALEEYFDETGRKEVVMPMSAWVCIATKKA